ncbi:MAG: pilus assembly protein CpaE [Propionibacterium sp.]|nr:pilus assembly protein CpaE [Propionibacterium sp.]
MLDLTLALALRDAGLVWRPAPGDRFVVTAAELVDDVFHIADMVVEARELETGTIFAFNGTTEWALDSVAQERTVWLPSEGQLRTSLGSRFRSLGKEGEFVVTLDDGREFLDRDPENAYARALLAVLES